MAKKPKNKKASSALAAPAQVQLAEQQLQDGRVQDAINTLFRVEAEIRRYSSPGKGPTLPLHLANLQPVAARLMARAMFERSSVAETLEDRCKDLHNAVQRAPADTTYLLALGACQLLAENSESAYDYFAKAQMDAPDNPLVKRAVTLGLLATGKTREVRDARKASPEENLDAPLQRLFAMRDFFVGHQAQAAALFAPTATAKPSVATHLFGGLLALAAGDVSNAQQRLNDIPAFDRNPSTGERAALATQFFYRGALSFELGNLEAAASALFEAEDLAQKTPIKLPFLARLPLYFHKLAEAALQHSEVKLAVECWQRTLTLNPKDQMATANLIAALRVLGNQAWREGRHLEALEYWQRALQHTPQDEKLLLNAAAACQLLERHEEVLIHLRALARRWRQQVKQDADATLKERLLVLEKHLIEKMMKADRPNHEIISELDAALSLDAANPEMRRKYIEFYFDIGQPKQALKHIEYLERHGAESAELLAQKGLALEMTNKATAAHKCLERALELEPTNPLARQAYLASLGREGANAVKRKQLASAINLFQKQLEIEPTYKPALINMGYVYFSMDEVEKAQAALAQAIAAHPDDAHAYVNVGAVYFHNGYNKEAKALFKQAEALNPSADCLFEIGDIYLSECKHKEGAAYFERAAKTASAEMLIEMYITLTEHHDDKKIAKTLEHLLELVMQKNPSLPLPHLVKFTHMMTQGNLAAAEAELVEAERLILANPEYAPMMKEVDEFKRTFKQIKQLVEKEGLPPALLGLLGKVKVD